MHVGIVGAGIMGCLLALELRNAGHKVSIFDRSDSRSNCSSNAAGLLTPFSELDKAERIIFQLGDEALTSHWPSIIHQLSVPIYFKQAGTLVLSHPQDKTEWDLFSRRIAHQLKEGDCYRALSNNELARLEPELLHFEKGYYFPKEGQIDCQSLLIALEQHLKSKEGIEWLTQDASPKPYRIIATDQEYRFDMVFDCRGLGAKSAFSDLRAVRGELIWLHAPKVSLSRPIRLLHPRYNLYLVPRPEDIILIGASEIEGEDYSPVSVRTALELLTAAYYVDKGFIEARIINLVTHCRPTLTNHLPRISFTPGLVAINGLYRHGYLIAPTLAKNIMHAMNTQFIDLQPTCLWEEKP